MINITYFSSGIQKLVYLYNGTQRAVIHFIIYDTIHMTNSNSYPTSSTGITGLPLTFLDTQIFSYTPRIYTYLKPWNQINFGYDWACSDSTNTQGKLIIYFIGQCLMPFSGNPTPTNCDYNKIDTYLWLPQPLSKDSGCSSSIRKYNNFTFYFKAQYTFYLLSQTTFNTVVVNSVNTSSNSGVVTLFRKNSFILTLTPTNLASTFILSVPTTEYSAQINSNFITYEEKDNHEYIYYSFIITITNNYDQLKSVNLTLKSVQYFGDTFYNGQTLYNFNSINTIPNPITNAINTSLSTSNDFSSSIINVNWYPGDNLRMGQTLLFTFTKSGVDYKTTVTICVGPKCRFAPKNFSVTPSGCSKKNDNYTNTWFYDCVPGSPVTVTGSLNFSNTLVMKLGPYKINYTKNGNIYSFNLPPTQSSGCLPLFIYNNCIFKDVDTSNPLNTYISDIAQCQNSNLINYFFTFSKNNSVSLLKITPYLLDVSKNKIYYINMYGENLNPDLRCFYISSTNPNPIELVYLHSSDIMGTCKLSIDSSNSNNLNSNLNNGTTYSIYLQQKQFSATNLSCTDYKTINKSLIFKNLSQIIPNYSDQNSIPIVNNYNGHQYGGYPINISIPNIGVNTNSYSPTTIMPTSIFIKFGVNHHFNYDSKNDENIVLTATNTTTLNFKFIIPPKWQEALNMTTSPVNSFNFALSINDGADYLPSNFTHTYVNPPSTGGYSFTSATATICEKGKYCPTSNLFSPFSFLCIPGKFNNQTGQSDCTTCETNFMCPEEGMVMEEPCFPGYVCDAPGIIFPTYRCPPGWYCTSGNAPYICPSNYYCEEGTTTPNPFVIQKSYFGSNTDTFWAPSYTAVNLTDENTINSNINRSLYVYLNSDPNYFKLYLDSNSPIPCLNGFDCNTPGNKYTRIWGQGKCSAGYFCPLNVDDRTQAINMINLVNKNYTCYVHSCECPEGNILNLF